MKTIVKVKTVVEALENAAEEMQDRRMYVFEGSEISFKDVDNASDHIAAGLLKIGIRKGDRIGLIGTNQPEWIYTYFAAAKIGAVIVALNVRYRDVELEYMLNQSGAKALVTIANLGDMDYVSYFYGFKEKIPTVKDFIFIGDKGFSGSHSFDDLLKTEIDRDALDSTKSAVKPDDLLIIIYTSGTTGKPKGAAISHKSQIASAFAQVEHAKMTDEDVMLIVLPLNHVGGITCSVLASLLSGATGVLIPVPDLDDVVKQTGIYKPTVFGGVPTLYTLLFMNENFKTFDSSHVRLAIAGGSNVEPSLLKQLNDVFPNAKLMNLYGLSESSGALVLSPWESDFDTTVRTIGKPIGDFLVKIIDSKGNEVKAGELGELCFKGDAICRGYFEMPDETRESFDNDGWFHTGDMGSLDNEGYITLKGRKKEMYLQGGYNVYPVEVENVLAKHPKVLMAAGIGVPDPVLGEVGRYYIIPQPGTEPTEEEIKKYCKQLLADYKVPRQIVFKDSLPMTPVGKIMKIKLREDFEESGE